MSHAVSVKLQRFGNALRSPCQGGLGSEGEADKRLWWRYEDVWDAQDGAEGVDVLFLYQWSEENIYHSYIIQYSSLRAAWENNRGHIKRKNTVKTRATFIWSHKEFFICVTCFLTRNRVRPERNGKMRIAARDCRLRGIYEKHPPPPPGWKGRTNTVRSLTGMNEQHDVDFS